MKLFGIYLTKEANSSPEASIAALILALCSYGVSDSSGML